MESSEPSLTASIEEALHASKPQVQLPIGLIGGGWIGELQLAAYQRSGFDVAAICDRNAGRAAALRDQYFPDAAAYESVTALLEDDRVQVMDLATHVDGRAALVDRCLDAGLHVMCQKPFVERLEIGEALSEHADRARLRLAVNQNGRWAPHFGAMLAVVEADLIGDVVSADFFVAWPHDVVVADRSLFSEMADLILYDFGAHWFDLVGVLAGSGPLEVRAVVARRPGQRISAPLQASAVITGADFMSTVVFRAGERYAEQGSYRVSGTRGVITHLGASLGGHEVTVHCDGGTATIHTDDDWFAHGLAGSMGSLLRSITDDTEPPHHARSSLRGLSIAFAALDSAASGEAVAAGSATSRPSAVGTAGVIRPVESRRG